MSIGMVEHKGYMGRFEFDEKADLFRGKVFNIRDLITFEGKTVESTKLAFKNAVNEYLSWCEKHRASPKAP